MKKLEQEYESIVKTNKILTEKVRNLELLIKKFPTTTNTTDIEVLPIDSANFHENNSDINRLVDNTNIIQPSYAHSQSTRTSSDQISI